MKSSGCDQPSSPEASKDLNKSTNVLSLSEPSALSELASAEDIQNIEVSNIVETTDANIETIPSTR